MPSPCSEFNEYLSILADNKLNSLLSYNNARLSPKRGSKTFENINCSRTLGNIFLGLGDDLSHLLVSFPQDVQDSNYNF